MILQALSRYYDRIAADPESGIANPGFSPQKISFAVVLTKRGSLVEIMDLRKEEGGKIHPMEMMVPEGAIRAVNVSANFMWDNCGYVLGVDNKGKAERTAKTHKAFKELHRNIGNYFNDDGMKAVLLFLNKWKPRELKKVKNREEIAAGNLVFRLDREKEYIHERSRVRKAWLEYHHKPASDAVLDYCLVTGRKSEIARLHNPIKGVRDAQTSGARIVSFNLESFCSYGKEQNYNAPVSEEAAFAYTTALNYLLRYESRQKIVIGDVTIAFWTERKSPVEDWLGDVLDPRDTEAADNQEVLAFLERIRDGKPVARIDEDVQFYLLGISPNSSRLSVRIWCSETVGDLARHIGYHFKDLRLVRNFENEKEYPGLWELLRDTARKYRRGQKPIDSDINPGLSSAMMKAILMGARYPDYLLPTIVGRIQADGEINYLRASMIKAVLVRKARQSNIEMEVGMALNMDLKDPGYRLGRLFAVLEKAQESSSPGINATIRDRYYGSASATPASVFPILMRLSQHHVGKMEGGGKTYFEKMKQEILGEVDKFPAHLDLDGQGMFALGYYHQRKDLFTKKTQVQSAEGGEQ